MEELPGYDRWKTTPPDDVEEGRCEHCGREIYKGEDFIRTSGGEDVHEDCWREFSLNRIVVTEGEIELPRCDYCETTFELADEYYETSDGEKIHRDCWDEFSLSALNASTVYGES